VRPILTDDGSWTFESERYGETFRSRRGAARESLHVFLEGSGVAARLEAGLATRVLEIGLGTTLNLVLTASAAVRTGTPLEYVSVEREPLPADALESLDLAAVGDPGWGVVFLPLRRYW
jgi:tRNA U34 5-methylaminomethyl-2-thiouridine-forming methyltransferase MnmC